MKRVLPLTIFAALVVLMPARLSAQDDQYLHIYDLIQQADSWQSKGKTAEAIAAYRQAQNELRTLKLAYPKWDTQMVNYRLGYLANKITALSQPKPAVAPGTSPTSQTGAETPAPSATSPSGQSAETISGERVELLDAGAEPRRVLRLHVRAGDRQTMNITMKSGMGMKMGDAPAAQPMQMPAITMTMDVTVNHVSANGDISYSSAMKDVKVADAPGTMPGIADVMKAALAGFKGLVMTGVMSDRGLTKSLDVKLPPDADAQTRQMLGQMKESLANVSTPLPEEAVGPGARWRVTMPIKSQGMTLRQTVTYQLVSGDTNHFEAKMSLAQHAAHQQIQNPAMPGLKVELIKLDGTGDGNISFDLSHALPSRATMNEHSELQMGMNVSGRRQTMDMTMDMAMEFEPVGAGTAP